MKEALSLSCCGGIMEREQQQRQAFLSLFLATLGFFFILLVLILLSGGFFFYCVLIGAGLCALCMFHYVLWGRSLSEQVAGEREEEVLRQLAESDDRTFSNSHHIRR
jgi:hypothetical protein